MSRTIFEVTLKLPDGGTFSGRGRSLPITIERIYNEGVGPEFGRHIVLDETFRRGYVTKDEERYVGTFHAHVVHTPTKPHEVKKAIIVEVKAPVKVAR